MLAVSLITIVLILTVFTLAALLIFAFFPILTMGAPFVPSYRPKNKSSSAHLTEVISFGFPIHSLTLVEKIGSFLIYQLV